MSDGGTTHATFVIERGYDSTPSRVFRAFADPTERRLWFVESGGHDVETFILDFRVGGAELFRYSFKSGTPFAGVTVVNQGHFQDIVPDRRIVTASTMTLANRRISASLVTIELAPTRDGTTLICTHQAAFFPGADGAAIREAGWRQLFERLAGVLE